MAGACASAVSVLPPGLLVKHDIGPTVIEGSTGRLWGRRRRALDFLIDQPAAVGVDQNDIGGLLIAWGSWLVDNDVDHRSLVIEQANLTD